MRVHLLSTRLVEIFSAKTPSVRGHPRCLSFLQGPVVRILLNELGRTLRGFGRVHGGDKVEDK